MSRPGARPPGGPDQPGPPIVGTVRARTVLASRSPGETRHALIEDDRVADIVILRDGAPAYGAIHLGRVLAPVAGLAAVLVDIGAGRPAFLAREPGVAGRPKAAGPRPAGLPWPPAEGAAVLVQVTREERRGKGATVTRLVTLAGSRLVFSPFRAGVALSRRLTGEAERARLAAALTAALTAALGAGVAAAPAGVVVRGAAAGAPVEGLAAELAALQARWRTIAAAAARPGAGGPARLDAGVDPLTEWLVLPGPAPAEIVCDDPDLAAQARRQWAGVFGARPDDAPVRLAGLTEAVFEAAGVEAEIETALSPEVPLTGGGRLVFEHTAALTAIDVDTGGGGIGSVNQAAAVEIARHIRLRGLGGVMVVDFAGGAGDGRLGRAVQALRAAVAADPVPVQVLGPSPVGLVEMVRERRRTPLADLMQEPCPGCAGGGRVTALPAVALAALRALLGEARAQRRAGLGLAVAPPIRDLLAGPLAGAMDDLIRRLGDRPAVVAEPGLGRDGYRVTGP